VKFASSGFKIDGDRLVKCRLKVAACRRKEPGGTRGYGYSGFVGG
jgi:hypothetical protein